MCERPVAARAILSAVMPASVPEVTNLIFSAHLIADEIVSGLDVSTQAEDADPRPGLDLASFRLIPTPLRLEHGMCVDGLGRQHWEIHPAVAG